MIRPIPWRKIAISVLGSAILSFGMYNIHAQSQVTEGGVMGLTLLLSYWMHISPAVSGLILNGLCYIVGFRQLGWKFIAYSVVSSVSFSLFYALWEAFPPVYPEISYYPLAAAVVGAIFIGVGVGMCVRCGGAPGGDDALAMALSDRFRVPISWVYLISDLSVLGLSLTYIPWQRILYSLLTVVLSGQIVGWVSNIGLRKEKA